MIKKEIIAVILLLLVTVIISLVVWVPNKQYTIVKEKELIISVSTDNQFRVTPEVKYVYFTSTGKVVTSNKIYKIGDSIEIIKYK